MVQFTYAASEKQTLWQRHALVIGMSIHMSQLIQVVRSMQDDMIDQDTLLQVRFDEPLKSVTPEQAFVMYHGDVCLGSALVQHSGPTEYEKDADTEV